jgi:predicted SnoaL-like aldol condensation-catalyzing enzyme
MKNFLTFVSVCVFGVLVSCNPDRDKQASNSKYDSHQNDFKTIQKQQETEAANKTLVAEFYQQLFGDKDVSAIDKFLLPTYIQHNPSLPDGSEALKKAATQWFAGAPKEKIDIQHISADGDLVFIHLRTKMGGKVFSVIDVFRIENGKIAEHWDVLQEVPAKSANDHPMF